jgi:hypothetical protein
MQSSVLNYVRYLGLERKRFFHIREKRKLNENDPNVMKFRKISFGKNSRYFYNFSQAFLYNFLK